LYPSVQFGLEAAAANLLAAEKGVPLSRLLSAETHPVVSINGLLMGTVEKMIETAEKLLTAGYRALKLKVGRLRFDEEIALLRRLRRLAGPEVLLRLDANRAWDVEQARRFVTEIADCKIDYIEEPVKTSKMLLELLGEENLAVPVALDETLSEIDPAELNRFAVAKAVVVKPTFLGWRKSRQFAERAQVIGMQVVVSSAFESGVGIFALVHLAASVNTEDVPAGLDTLRWLKQDILADDFLHERSRILVEDLPLLLRLRRDLLCEVEGRE
jgi:O-succinylbenzoate synthase